MSGGCQRFFKALTIVKVAKAQDSRSEAGCLAVTRIKTENFRINGEQKAK